MVEAHLALPVAELEPGDLGAEAAARAGHGDHQRFEGGRAEDGEGEEGAVGGAHLDRGLRALTLEVLPLGGEVSMGDDQEEASLSFGRDAGESRHAGRVGPCLGQESALAAVVTQGHVGIGDRLPGLEPEDLHAPGPRPVEAPLQPRAPWLDHDQLGPGREARSAGAEGVAGRQQARDAEGALAQLLDPPRRGGRPEQTLQPVQRAMGRGVELRTQDPLSVTVGEGQLERSVELQDQVLTVLELSDHLPGQTVRAPGGDHGAAAAREGEGARGVRLALEVGDREEVVCAGLEGAPRTAADLGPGHRGSRGIDDATLEGTCSRQCELSHVLSSAGGGHDDPVVVGVVDVESGRAGRGAFEGEAAVGVRRRGGNGQGLDDARHQERHLEGPATTPGGAVDQLGSLPPAGDQLRGFGEVTRAHARPDHGPARGVEDLALEAPGGGEGQGAEVRALPRAQAPLQDAQARGPIAEAEAQGVVARRVGAVEFEASVLVRRAPGHHRLPAGGAQAGLERALEDDREVRVEEVTSDLKQGHR